ncbi:MAG: GntR family transcriptional regulator, partial [Chloroflexota bacterium]|nr:GntR family transcriptional regulator [Chloroflexota bacterium]
MTSIPSAPLYERIAADVLRRVAAGELRPGDRLAPVRRAARDWGVNLNTVARAYALLADRGILETRAGGGTVVA